MGMWSRARGRAASILGILHGPFYSRRRAGAFCFAVSFQALRVVLWRTVAPWWHTRGSKSWPIRGCPAGGRRVHSLLLFFFCRPAESEVVLRLDTSSCRGEAGGLDLLAVV